MLSFGVGSYGTLEVSSDTLFGLRDARGGAQVGDLGIVALDVTQSASAAGAGRHAGNGVGRMAILTCPGCDRGGLRVPDGRRGKVTCPSCGAEWFHPDMVEFSDVEFRCSKSGARFTATLSRRSPFHKFVVQEIKKATHGPTRTLSTEPVRSPQPAPSLRLSGPTRGRWLTGILGRKASLTPSTTPMPTRDPKAESASMATPAVPRDISEYNWSGLRCPYCDASSFVHCRAGGHLVCDGTVELRDGRRFYQCFCGHAAYIEGSIKTLDDTRRSGRAEARAVKSLYQESQALIAVPETVVAPLTKAGPKQ
jgi:hypothetical protein